MEFVIQKTEKSKCPTCHRSLTLLSADLSKEPAFYICFPCEEVYQIGKGPVKKVGSDDEELEKEEA